jgi:hypothetical protein
MQGGIELMDKEDWKTRNGFGYLHSCLFCAYFHEEDDELLDGDQDYCEEHGVDKDKETLKSFCREMRDDGGEDYYLMDVELKLMGCYRWRSNDWQGK